MVTVRYQREQEQEAARKKRLLAARRAAAEASVLNAKRYQEQKQQQQVAVRADLQARWSEDMGHRRGSVRALIDSGLAKQGQGMWQAAVVVAGERGEARREAVAWEAEGRLEAARHDAAAGAMLVARQQRDGDRDERRERMRLVRGIERERSAAVVAGPRNSTYADVAAQLAPVYTVEERRATARSGVVHGGLHRPLVNMSVRDDRPDTYPEMAAAEVEQTVREAAADREAELWRQRAAAGRRAAEAMRGQRAEVEAQQQGEQQRRERARAAAGVYGRPSFNDDEEQERGGNSSSRDASLEARGGGDMSPTAAATAAPTPFPHPSAARASPIRRPRAVTATASTATAVSSPLSAHPATDRRRSVQVAREAEAEFERVFVTGPPVLLKEEVGPSDGAPRSLAELLRPAQLHELLPSRFMSGQQGSADDGEDGGHAALGICLARICPCRFQTRPVVIHVDVEEDSATAAAAAAVPPVEFVRPAWEQPESPTAPGPAEPVAEEQPAHPPQAAIEESRPEEQQQQQQPSAVHATDRQQTPVVADLSRISAGGARSSPPAIDLSRITAPTNVSISTSGSSSYSSSSSSSSSTSEPDSGDETATTNLSDDSAFDSSTASHYQPSMTAEQLRIALVRLRNRMRMVDL